VTAADLTTLSYPAGRALEVLEARRNLEGACIVGDDLRWFQRGHRQRGLVDASIDVDLTAMLDAITGDADTLAPRGGTWSLCAGPTRASAAHHHGDGAAPDGARWFSPEVLGGWRYVGSLRQSRGSSQRWRRAAPA
jgi:hypothetical protein